ncbi:Putative ferric reductase transmembrane component-like domain-containing protein [Septoria linicola]|uniref:Ferric reductase transmembrane component-like domain-containing protein n=1 Tax=Septoria linicola TaxID=215465 RepID=A0A9Q9B1L2_9PEZI|nr:Putative ferric reductase transmembrane component-like domain-containing protein [Septoria linicola]
MKRITPRTCLWPLIGCVSITFALSIGLTYRSDHHCYAGTCGETLFPLQARLHVVVWYIWISLSITLLGLRAFRPTVRNFVSTALGYEVPLLGKQLRASGLLLVFWILSLYGILIGIWWIRLRDYFHERGEGLPGNNVVAAVALTGHLADVTMGMVLLPVSRHSALASFFKLSPSTIYTFHMTMAYILFALVLIHGALYADWAALYNQNREAFRLILPVLNPTYIYEETWPGLRSALGVWKSSLIFTGIVSSLIMVAMLFTSFPVVRRKWFNVFYFTHLFGIVAVIIICLHASTMFYCTIPGLSMWLLDWSMRVFELKEKLDSKLSSLGNGWYSLTLPLPRKRLSGCACHSPLAHFYIHHSATSALEIHPYTTITHLASKKPMSYNEEYIDIQFLFRQSQTTVVSPSSRRNSQWTNKLGAMVDEEKAELPRQNTLTTETRHDSFDASIVTTMRMEGPYFTPANPELYKTVVCLVAGTGLSGALAIAAAFQAQRSGAKISCATSAIALTEDALVEDACTMPAKRENLWTRCVVVWTVREKDYTHIPFVEELKCEGLEIQVHKTGNGLPRLDMDKALSDIVEQDGKSSWCYISGPGGFISSAERACEKVQGMSWFAARWD